MSESCEACFIIPIIYIILCFFIYLKHKSARMFVQMVMIPIPIAIVTTFIILGIYGDEYGYEWLVRILTVSCVAMGMAVLLHTIIDMIRKKRFLIIIRLIAGLILITLPLMLLFTEYYYLMIALLITDGVLLGIYGYFSYYKGEKHGLLYIYGSIMFMVIGPAIALMISIIYMENIKDELLYRRYEYGFVSCHDASAPIISDKKEFQLPFVFSFGYLGLIGLLNAIRKSRLRKHLKEKGIIPEDFDKIINGRKK